jgi:hypothetical protein
MEWVVNVTNRLLYARQRDSVSIIQEAGWTPRPVSTGAENLAAPPAFQPRTVQSAVSRYNAYAIRELNIVHNLHITCERDLIYNNLSVEGHSVETVPANESVVFEIQAVY